MSQRRALAVHEELLQRENCETLVEIGDDCFRKLLVILKQWGWAEEIPDPYSVSELRQIPDLFRRRWITVGAKRPELSELVGRPASIQDFGHTWKRAKRPSSGSELLFCRRSTDVGPLFENLRNERNRLYHDAAAIGSEHAAFLASTVLMLVAVVGRQVEIEPVRLDALSACSRRALRTLYADGQPQEQSAPASSPVSAPVTAPAFVPPSVEGISKPLPARVSCAADGNGLFQRIESGQQDLCRQIDRLPGLLMSLLDERRVSEARPSVPDVLRDEGVDLESPSAEFSRRRQALRALRDRIRDETAVDNWQNICQLPIVDALLRRKRDGFPVHRRKDLFDTAEFTRKYDRHTAVMERLLGKYGGEMLRLLGDGGD